MNATKLIVWNDGLGAERAAARSGRLGFGGGSDQGASFRYSRPAPWDDLRSHFGKAGKVEFIYIAPAGPHHLFSICLCPSVAFLKQ